jgi:hypothetical protein
VRPGDAGVDLRGRAPRSQAPARGDHACLPWRREPEEARGWSASWTSPQAARGDRQDALATREPRAAGSGAEGTAPARRLFSPSSCPWEAGSGRCRRVAGRTGSHGPHPPRAGPGGRGAQGDGPPPGGVSEPPARQAHRRALRGGRGHAHEPASGGSPGETPAGVGPVLPARSRRQESYRAGAVGGERRRHGPNGGEGET